MSYYGSYYDGGGKSDEETNDQIDGEEGQEEGQEVEEEGQEVEEGEESKVVRKKSNTQMRGEKKHKPKTTIYIIGIVFGLLIVGLLFYVMKSSSTPSPVETSSPDSSKADKEKADKEKADKEKSDKAKADKEKADKEKADKEKADKEKADAAYKLTPEYINNYIAGGCPAPTVLTKWTNGVKYPVQLNTSMDLSKKYNTIHINKLGMNGPPVGIDDAHDYCAYFCSIDPACKAYEMIGDKSTDCKYGDCHFFNTPYDDLPKTKSSTLIPYVVQRVSIT